MSLFFYLKKIFVRCREVKCYSLSDWLSTIYETVFITTGPQRFSAFYVLFFTFYDLYPPGIRLFPTHTHIISPLTYHLTLLHIITCPIIPYHLTYHYIHHITYPILLHYIISYPIPISYPILISYLITYHHITYPNLTYHIISHHITSHHIISYHITYHILTLSYPHLILS